MRTVVYHKINVGKYRRSNPDIASNLLQTKAIVDKTPCAGANEKILNRFTQMARTNLGMVLCKV